MQVVIFCGGKGTRMGDNPENTPKPLFKIGEHPVLWHIMKFFHSQGLNEFILCAGYGFSKIEDFVNDIKESERWDIKVINTGLDSTKLERIKKIEKYLKGELFFVAYGDDLSNVDLNKLLNFHREHKGKITITGARIRSPFGLVRFDEDGKIKSFEEKPLLNEWINGGFMIFNREVFRDLNESAGEIESDLFPKLAERGEIYLYKHPGEWKSMNTLKENLELNELWRANKAFWKIW